MNLLVLSNNPKRASFRQRIGVYLDTLRKNGMDCEVEKLPSGELARWKLFKRVTDFDGVFLHKKTLNPLDAVFLRRYAKKIIYDFDDAIMYSDKHPDRPSGKRQRAFRRTVKLADMVIADNSYLAVHARNHNTNVAVLTTGLDVDEYRQDTAPPDDGKLRLVWIGSQSTLNYLAQIKPALEQIGSRFDNVVLRIICDDFFDLQNMETEKRRWALETQAVDLAQSHIGLAPLPDNKFTQSRFCFKILQYAAAGLPVIASPVGANAEYIREGTNGFHAADCSEWIDKISTLLNDSRLRKRLGRTGRAQVQQYDLKIVGKQLAELIMKCLHSAKS